MTSEDEVNKQMEAVCRLRDPAELPQHQKNRIDRYSGEYPVSIGKVYAVAAMMIYENRLLFLIRDDHGGPRFVPAAFFDVTSQDVPSWWRFALGEGIRAADSSHWDMPVSALWGYPEFVDDVQHVNDLSEQIPAALVIFDQYIA